MEFCFGMTILILIVLILFTETPAPTTMIANEIQKTVLYSFKTMKFPYFASFCSCVFWCSLSSTYLSLMVTAGVQIGAIPSLTGTLSQ